MYTISSIVLLGANSQWLDATSGCGRGNGANAPAVSSPASWDANGRGRGRSLAWLAFATVNRSVLGQAGGLAVSLSIFKYQEWRMESYPASLHTILTLSVPMGQTIRFRHSKCREK
jgi:hypothetical protein